MAFNCISLIILCVFNCNVTVSNMSYFHVSCIVSVLTLYFVTFNNIISQCCFNVRVLRCSEMAQLELIDPVIDAKHRSRVEGGQLNETLRLRTFDDYWRLDPRWIPRYVKCFR